MARLLATSNINWTSSSWQVLDTTAYLNSEAASTATTTTAVASASYTTGVISVDGILLRILGTTASPTGTFTVELYNASLASIVTSVTCNATDITNNDTTLPGGWCYFKFSGTQVLLAATNYQVRVKSSVSGTVTVYRNATAGNWSFGLVTTTTAALAASDEVIVCGDITAAATTALRTVTHDYTGANSYGSLEVGAYGKIVGQNSASTNYRLAINTGGKILIAHNGIIEYSTTGSRLPSTSTFYITLTSGSAGGNTLDIRNYGTFRAVGEAKTRKAKLAADAAASATSLTTDVSTSWKNGDNIGIAATTTTGSQSERKSLTADASGTTLTIAALTNAHGGNSTTGVQGHLINLSSNFQIMGTSITSTYAIRSVYKSIIDLDNIEIKWLGNSTSSIMLSTRSGGTASFKDCAFWDNQTTAYLITPNSHEGNITIDGCVSFGTNTAFLYTTSPLSTSTSYSIIKNCVTMIATTHIYISGDKTFNCTDHVSVGGTSGFYIGDGQVAVNIAFNNLIAYATAQQALALTTCRPAYISGTAYIPATFSNLTFWRNPVGIVTGSGSRDIIIDTFNFFGNNSTGGIQISGSPHNILFKNGSMQGGTTFVSPYGIYISGQDSKKIRFDNCSFGTVTAHSTADIILTAQNTGADMVFRNCSFGTSTTLSGQSFMSDPAKIAMQRFGGTAGAHRTYIGSGTLTSDSVIYDSSPVSQRLTPISSVNKLYGSIFSINVPTSSVATVTVKVRKSVSGDGATYNGNQPRLILKANPSAHSSAYNSDIVAATATNAANGAWETLSYTLPSAVTDNVGMEFYIDCDGTAGWVNWDTVTVT